MREKPQSEQESSKAEREFKPVELNVVKKPGREWGVEFTCADKATCAAYNSAIEKALKEAGMGPFHQNGVTTKGSNEPGYHFWECWTSDEATAEFKLKLETKIIHAMAESDFPIHAQLYPNEESGR